MSRTPSLNWLRVFEAAARMESFAAAARGLNMTAPAVSQQIRALEDALGEPLFERGPKNVALTRAGRAYLPAVRHALQGIDTTTQALFGGHRSPPVFLQALHLFGASWLAERLPAFHDRHPDIQVNIATDPIEPEVRFLNADLKIVYAPVRADNQESLLLMNESLVPVAAPETAVCIRTPDDLLTHRLIEISSNAAGWPNVLETVRSEQLNTVRYVFVDNTVTAFALAAGGGAVALARPPVSDFLQARFGLVPCLEGLVGHSAESYRLMPHPTRPLSRSASQFQAWLLETARQN